MLITTKTLIYLSEQQNKLDKYIFDKNNLFYDQKIFSKKICAFFVELGEFANEERSFKYWSRKPASALDIQLFEYIDGLHFLLSIGNDLQFPFADYEFVPVKQEMNLIDLYLLIYKNLGDFVYESNLENFEQLFNNYLTISQLNNYSNKKILDAYEIKNKINFERQDKEY